MADYSPNNAILQYLRECETKILKLENGEPFAIVIKSDDIDSDAVHRLSEALKEPFKELFGDLGRRIPIFIFNTDEEIDFITLKEVMEKTDGIS